MAEAITISSDRDLVDAARNADDLAWAELVARHRPAVLQVARIVKSSGATKRADAAMEAVHRDVVAGEVDLDAVTTDRPQIRDVRCRGLAALTGGTVGPALPPPNQRLDDVRRTEMPDRQDLVALATAFLQSPWAWQTVLWHGRAEARTAAEISPLLGRSANDVNVALQAAEAGLFELYLRADAARISDLDSTSAALLPLIGGHRRGVLSPIDRQRVDELLERRNEGDSDGLHAARWLVVGASLDTMIPQALVPGLVGQSVERFWAVLGVGAGAIGVAGLASARSERVRRTARIGAVAAIIVAILGAAFLIRNPFSGLDASLISDLTETEAPPGSHDGDGDDGDASGTDPDGSADGSDQAVDTIDDTVNLVFPGARQGAVYVPGQDLLQLSAVLSAKTPFVAGGTGTLGLTVTNNDNDTARVRVEIRATEGIALQSGSGGSATCRTPAGGSASCSFTLPPGATATLSLVFALSEDLIGDITFIPNIPGKALTVPIV